MFMCGVYNVKQTQIAYDYKKWLGPDWKPTYEGYGIQVSNHISWLDIMALLYT